MWKAVIVDRDYGSVSIEHQKKLQSEYAQRGIDLRMEHYTTPEEIISGCKEADAILATGNPPITRDVLESLPNLKLVQRFGIGVNSVDLKAAEEAGVLVLNMPGFCLDELALHASALIFDLLRNVSFYDRGIRQGEWRKARGPVPRNPGDLTLGLYGFGGSAKSLYNIFHNSFATKILVYDPYINDSVKNDYDVEIVSFDELLTNCDIISIHAPLTPETRHIFNKSAFEKMKSDAILVNISRGELVKQDDLIEALENNEIGFAGLDVFEQEPLPADSPLTKSDRVVLTCHSAFYGLRAQQNQLKLALELVDYVLNQKFAPRRYIADRGVTSKIPDFTVKS